MRKNGCLAVVLTVLICFPARSFAWIDCGHKVVALIAWPDLSPKAKAAVTALLKTHPQYSSHLLAEVEPDATDDMKDRRAFATAATWPDLVRSQNNPMHTLYNHPSWHFIDIPVYEGYANPSTEPTPKDETSKDGQPVNAIEALNFTVKQLKDASVKDSDKAIDLCWIEHVVGDIHQPLHAASLFSPSFPEGDQGGNAEEVLSEPPYPNSREKLHLYWDKLPGEFKSLLMDGFVADGVRGDPKFSRGELKPLLEVTDFMAWAKESNQLAAKYAYDDGHIDFVPSKRASRSESSVPGLSDEYAIHAEHLAMHQVAVGGYRLADLLNSIFDSGAATVSSQPVLNVAAPKDAR